MWLLCSQSGYKAAQPGCPAEWSLTTMLLNLSLLLLLLATAQAVTRRDPRFFGLFNIVR